VQTPRKHNQQRVGASTFPTKPQLHDEEKRTIQKLVEIGKEAVTANLH